MPYLAKARTKAKVSLHIYIHRAMLQCLICGKLIYTLYMHTYIHLLTVYTQIRVYMYIYIYINIHEIFTYKYTLTNKHTYMHTSIHNSFLCYAAASPLFPAIQLLHDPQRIAEQLFKRLRQSVNHAMYVCMYDVVWIVNNLS
jgi:hypothetical protein